MAGFQETTQVARPWDLVRRGEFGGEGEGGRIEPGFGRVTSGQAHPDSLSMLRPNHYHHLRRRKRSDGHE